MFCECVQFLNSGKFALQSSLHVRFFIVSLNQLVWTYIQESTYQVLIGLAFSLWQEMLKEKGVAPFSKWEKELPKIIFDLRFKVGEVIFVVSAFLYVLHSSHVLFIIKRHDL